MKHKPGADNSPCKVISFKNYKDKKVKYIKGHTKNISQILNIYRKKIHSLFHFGEFSRIYQSFLKFNECYESNTIGTGEVFKFCFQNKIKLIYSATSATFGNKETNKNL